MVVLEREEYQSIKVFKEQTEEHNSGARQLKMRRERDTEVGRVHSTGRCISSGKQRVS